MARAGSWRGSVRCDARRAGAARPAASVGAMLKRLLLRPGLTGRASAVVDLAASASRGEPPPPAVAGTEGARCDPTDLGRRGLRDVFTPTQPQYDARRFVGRHSQLAGILRALTEERAHVVLYAERGRGKTSLANLVAQAAAAGGYMVARHACTAESRFDSIMRGLVSDLPRPLLTAPPDRAEEHGPPRGCEGALPPRDVRPPDVVALPRRLAGRLVFMIDEFDRVTDEAARTRLADTIKQVSDCREPLGFVIIGVSDSLEQLLGHHPSIERNVVGVPLPLLSDAEIDAIVTRGALEAGLEFPEGARRCIAWLARGVPYAAQLLALRAGQASLDRGSVRVTGTDLAAAIARVAQGANPRVRALYEELTEGGGDRAMIGLLRAIAAGPQDDFGRFQAVPCAGGAGWRVGGFPADAALWARVLASGAVRPCAEGGRHSFVPGEAAFPLYVLLRAVQQR